MELLVTRKYLSYYWDCFFWNRVCFENKKAVTPYKNALEARLNTNLPAQSLCAREITSFTASVHFFKRESTRHHGNLHWSFVRSRSNIPLGRLGKTSVKFGNH